MSVLMVGGPHHGQRTDCTMLLYETPEITYKRVRIHSYELGTMIELYVPAGWPKEMLTYRVMDALLAEKERP